MPVEALVTRNSLIDLPKTERTKKFANSLNGPERTSIRTNLIATLQTLRCCAWPGISGATNNPPPLKSRRYLPDAYNQTPYCGSVSREVRPIEDRKSTR